MKVRFFDRQDESNPLNGSESDSPGEVVRVIDLHRSRPPFIAELVGENGFTLMVGIGGPRGCVEYRSSTGALPYFVAVNSASSPSGEPVEFLIGGTPTPIARRHCLPSGRVRDLIRHFVETGQRSAAVVWEEI